MTVATREGLDLTKRLSTLAARELAEEGKDILPREDLYRFYSVASLTRPEYEANSYAAKEEQELTVGRWELRFAGFHDVAAMRGKEVPLFVLGYKIGVDSTRYDDRGDATYIVIRIRQTGGESGKLAFGIGAILVGLGVLAGGAGLALAFRGIKKLGDTPAGFLLVLLAVGAGAMALFARARG